MTTFETRTSLDGDTMSPDEIIRALSDAQREVRNTIPDPFVAKAVMLGVRIVAANLAGLSGPTNGRIEILDWLKESRK